MRSGPGRRVLVASVEDHDRHDTGGWHPERPERLQAVAAGVAAAGLGDARVGIEARTASLGELARAHDLGYLRSLARMCEYGGGELDPDTPVSPGSFETAARSAGLVLEAIDALRAGHAEAGFVAPRPPGHHAARAEGMGFCLVNHVAVAAAALVAHGHRVLVFDWDVHHGNGTQEIFWDVPDVLYVSTHQWPAYPGTGRPAETGGLEARGTTINVAFPPGATGEHALAVVDEIVAPAAERFAPDWVLISCGFDAHRDDPLAELAWSAGDFGLLAARLAALVPMPGRTLAVLEGGYDLAALTRCTTAVVEALAGIANHGEPPTWGGPGAGSVSETAFVHAQLEEELR